ncbi:MAG: hypothetical protein AB7E13_06345 [Arcobacteraceae bacterium]
MTHNIKNKNVIFTILIVFILSFSIYSVLSYIDSKKDIEYLKSKNVEQINNLSIILENNLENQLKSRINFILNLDNKEAKAEALIAKNKKRLHQLFDNHYLSLKSSYIFPSLTPKTRAFQIL